MGSTTVGVLPEDELETAWQSRRRDPATALAVAERIRDHATTAGDDQLRGQALTLEGACHSLRNEYVPGLRALLEAVALLREAPPLTLARALAELGYLECVLREDATGMERLLDALRIYEEHDHHQGVVATLTRIGVHFYSSGELEHAKRTYERCLGDYGHLADPIAIAGVRNNLAKVQTETGALDAAREQLALARRAFDAAGELRGVAMTEHNLALVHLADGRHDDARRRFETAIVHYERSGHPHGALEARIHLGRMLVDRAVDLPHAGELLHAAHEQAEQLGLPTECAQAADALTDWYEAAGELAEALRWNRHLRDVERRLFDVGSDQRLRALQVRYQLEELERDNITDALTGLNNRRGLDRALEEAVAEARAGGGSVGLLLLDLDDFKQINDVHSHGVGDEVLRHVAATLQAAVRSSDVCARLGGEEFVVVLPGCGLDQTMTVADQIRFRLDDPGRWTALADGLRVTASIGVATLTPGDDAASLLAEADLALYSAKRAGKNRVRSSAQLADPPDDRNVL